MARTIDAGAASSRLPWWILVLLAPFAAYHVLLFNSDLTRPEPIGFALATSDAGLVVRALTPDALIEAVSEGVIFTSLEHSVGQADAVAVLRPRLTDDFFSTER